MTTIIVVRHGNTFAAGEPARRIGCRTDPPLTDEGRTQAGAAGRWFAAQGWAFSLALHGPLRRTTETAELILAAQPAAVPAAPAPMLAEIDHGVDEGLPEAMVEARVGAAALRRWEEEGIAPPGWTVDREVRIGWWRSLFARPPGDTVLIVTSNGAARFALLALGTGAWGKGTLRLRTGAYGRLERDREGEPFRCVDWDRRPPSGDAG